MNRKQTHTAFSQSSQLLTLCPTCSLFSHAHTQSVLELVKIQLLPYFTPEYFSTWSILLHSQNTNITLGNLTPIQSYYLIYSPYSNLFIKNYALYLVVISLQFHLIQKNSLFFMTHFLRMQANYFRVFLNRQEYYIEDLFPSGQTLYDYART